MNRATIISLTRDLVNEISTDSGALLSDTGNLLRLLNASAEQLVLDLMPYMPHQFMKTKTISLVADQAGYSLASTITAATLAFVDSDPDTITDSGSAFVTNQFRAGMTIEVSGAGESGNNTTFTIESVAAGTLTLDSADSVTTEAASNSITITELNPFLQTFKIARNVSDKTPREIAIISPLEHQFFTSVGDTEESPSECWFEGDTLYFTKTPSVAKTDYAKVYLLPGEAVTVPTNGPKLIPQSFHPCIAYGAAGLVANMMESSPARFEYLYEKRLKSGLRVWRGRHQQQTRFIKPGELERRLYDDRDPSTYDTGWPD